MRLHTAIDSPVGQLTLIGEDGALCGVHFSGGKHPPSAEDLGEKADAHAAPVLDTAAAQLGEYFAGERTEFTLPLAAYGTVFQRSVWDLLRTIPYGSTWNYGELARRLGNPAAVRAVAAANGRNPISIIVPCHRVIGADGRLVGYGGGVDRKATLLALEQGRGSGTTVPLF